MTVNTNIFDHIRQKNNNTLITTIYIFVSKFNLYTQVKCLSILIRSHVSTYISSYTIYTQQYSIFIILGYLVAIDPCTAAQCI